MGRFDPITFYALLAAVFAEMSVLIVWCVAWSRVRRAFLGVIVFCSLIGFLSVAIQAVLAYDARSVAQWMGRDGYKIFYYTLACAQSVNAFLFLLGQILLVRWMIRANRIAAPMITGVLKRRI